MSHLHHINGQNDIADHYRVYLELSQAGRLAGAKEKVGEKSKMEESDSPPDPGQDPRGDRRRNPSNEEGKDSEDDADQTSGFGKHYA